jgi:peptide/nickel transport system substrate-binding protein
VTGEYTVEITAVQPMRFDFFYLLEEVPILSPSVLDNDPETVVEVPQGSGPYLVDEVVAEVSATVVRNPDYWNPDAYPFDEIEFIVYNDEVAALNALKSGQIDATALSLQPAQEAEAAGFTLHEGLGTFATLYFHDHHGTRIPALGDLRVRQAINMAFDREQIAESLYLGFGRVSSQPFTSGQAEYVEGGDEFYGYDLERAAELLAEAGYPDGFDLPILAFGTESIEPIVEQSLADIGIRVTYNRVADSAEWVSAITGGGEAAILLTHYFTNVARYLDPAYDFFLGDPETDHAVVQMLETIARGSAAESAEASQTLGHYLLENAWFAPFAKPPAVWASVPELEIKVGQILGVPNLREFQISG